MERVPAILKYEQNGSKEKKLFEFDTPEGLKRFMVLPLCSSFAVIAGVGPNNSETKLDDGFSLRSTGGRTAIRTTKGMFAVTWFDDYTLSFKGHKILVLQCLRQQEEILSEGVKRVKRT